MGLALPGKFPAEFSTDSTLYARWFVQISEMHANTLRIYTILPLEFYRALAPVEGERESQLTGVPTEGFRFAVVAMRPGPDVIGTIPQLDAYGNWPRNGFVTWTWRGWEEPTWHEYLKPAYFALQRLWRAP
jgi:hypothetical protein